jgi:Protein of unknown function (DUF2938)
MASGPEAAMNYLVSIPLGIGATALIDLWSLARRRIFGIAAPDFGLVGRWIAYLPRGRFRHQRIAAAAPARGERLIGWTAHYLTGVAFAALLLALTGRHWIQQPTLLPALLVGIGTVLAPFLVMQPGMGAGIAASRTPHPGAARLQSLITHAIFGMGLYAAALLVNQLTARN